jgi:Hpt domain
MDSSTETSVGARGAREEARHGAWTVDELRLVWEHQRGWVDSRIAVIEHALAALADGRLDADLRGDAERAAHTLAGSVGTFGFIRACKAARRLELELAHPTPERAPALSALLASVRGGVEGPVRLCPGVATDEE